MIQAKVSHATTAIAFFNALLDDKQDRGDHQGGIADPLERFHGWPFESGELPRSLSSLFF